VRRAAAVLLVAALAACISGRDCVNDIPADLRADVLRFVVDQRLCPIRLMPEADYAFAVGGGGRRYEDLDVDRRRVVAKYANGYAACITDRVEK
jgi:hypothetical protein